MPSFDIVSKTDLTEVDNALANIGREIATRFDFKNSQCKITREESTLAGFAASASSPPHGKQGMTLGDDSTLDSQPPECLMSITVAGLCNSSAARFKISGCPTTTVRQISCISGRAQAATIVSGPIPVGSPCVIARSGLEVCCFLFVLTGPDP